MAKEKSTGASMADIASAPGANAGGEPFPQGGDKPGGPEGGGKLGTTAAGAAAETRGSAGDAAGPASLGNRDNPSAGDPDAIKRKADADEAARAAAAPDTKVAIVPLQPTAVEVDASGMPKHFAAEGVEKRHWVYKRSGARFWKLVRQNEPKPVLMRNATHTWEGTEEEFKDQFERD